MNKMILRSFVFASMALGGQLMLQQQASADLFQCKSVDGSVRVWDREANSCGRLTENNSDWRYIGTNPWNDRIDQFGNDDWSRGRNMCLYEHILYGQNGWGGASVHLRPGYATTWNNKVSSNRWTTAGGC